ncbi:MAG: hypothetical protein SFU86_09665 [Pirellulaceae bacterium]|nr:hypothetical protein [Pirellulaceae bacterium]
MKYRVIWDPDAFHDLLRHWTAAGKPESAIAAFDQIENILSIDAHDQGESRTGNRRILLVPPVGVIFFTPLLSRKKCSCFKRG